ncbi:MAG: phage major capsid protein [Roseinatronobacter sp.]
MLDQNHPPARLLAQMRAITTKKELPDSIADKLAMRPGMTVKKATFTAETIERISIIAKRNQVDAEELDALVDGIIADVPEDGDVSPEMRTAAFERLNNHLVERDPGPAYSVGRPTAHGWTGVGRSFDQGPDFRAKMAAGLAARLDPKGQHSDMARDAARLSIAEIAMQVCRMQGLRPFDEVEAVRMATHSTSDFPLILENAMTNDVARRIDQRLPDLARASHEVARQDYRPGNSLTLSATGMPQEVAEGGEIKFVTAEEGGEALPRVRDFASGFNISNQAMTNDSTALRLLGDIGNRMAQGAIERLRNVLLEPILANSGAGQTMRDTLPMFHEDHGNLARTPAAISIDSLGAARTAMRKQKGLNGELYAVEPWGLVVPAELETVAQQILAQIDATKFSDANPFAGALELIVEPGLTSATAWYLVADPARYDGLAHAFLDGQRAPRIETRPGWNTLGLEMRLVWALDAKFIETATWYRNAGA